MFERDMFTPPELGFVIAPCMGRITNEHLGEVFDLSAQRPNKPLRTRETDPKKQWLFAQRRTANCWQLVAKLSDIDFALGHHYVAGTMYLRLEWLLTTYYACVKQQTVPRYPCGKVDWGKVSGLVDCLWTSYLNCSRTAAELLLGLKDDAEIRVGSVVRFADGVTDVVDTRAMPTMAGHGIAALAVMTQVPLNALEFADFDGYDIVADIRNSRRKLEQVMADIRALLD